MAFTIVVAGGSGFVGREIVARLTAYGHRVIVPTRRREAARDLILLPTVDVVECDITEPATLARMLRGADAMINLIGVLNESNRESHRNSFARVHVDFARDAVAACRAQRVVRYLQMSALNADAAGPSKYLRSKGEAEAIVAQSPLAWTIFRPNVIFGRDDSFLNKFVALGRVLPVIALGGADAEFQPVWVQDVADCFVHAFTDDATIGQRYELCGPKRYALRALVKWTLDTADTPRPVIPLPDALARLTASLLEQLPGKLLTRDNLDSMRVASICRGAFPPVFGFEPSALEALAPAWLSPAAQKSRYDDFRAQVGRS
ncbi:MAG: complex I NDUFA9 subunit family protein [Betaproteobacteria bacterium]